MTEEEQRDINHKDIKQELDEMWADIVNIKANKQDRIKLVVLVPALVWIIGVTVSGVWWASSMSAEVKYLRQDIAKAATDRYYAADAEKDLRLRDQRMDFLQEQIDALKDKHLRK